MEAANYIAIIGAIVAGIGVYFTFRQLHKNEKVTEAQLYLTIRQMLSKYDDVHSDLIEGNGPKDNDAKRKFEAYMGLFEHCGRMINDGLLSLETFKSIYEYRIKNMLTNNWIREDKLQDNRKGWCDFLDLCRKLGLDVPAPKRDKPKCPGE